jgi:hypothetical protein
MEASEKQERRLLRWGAQGGGVFAASLGFAAFLGCIAGLPILANFGAGLIPMAPRTALLFLVYGAGISFGHRFPSRRSSDVITIVVGSLGVAIALPLYFLSSPGIHLPIEHLGFSPVRTFGNVPLGNTRTLNLHTGSARIARRRTFLRSSSRSEW